jgi:acyl-CoA synthetase (NDP forming)
LSIKGAKAAASHTGALSSPEELNNALFRQANLIVANDYEELLDFLELFSGKIAHLRQNSLAIVTNAGGPGILAVDAASNFKINLPQLKEKDRRALKRILPSFASLANPLDLGGDADALSYQKVIKYLEGCDYFSAILAIVTPQTMTNPEQIAHLFASLRQMPKIFLACFLGGERVKKSLDILAKAHIPHYDDPAKAIELLSKIYQYSQKRQEVPPVINLVKTKQFKNLSEQELISRYALPFAKSYAVANDAEVMGHIEVLGYPVVYKAAKVKHRGQRGKVGLNINDHATLERAIRTIGFPGILQEMVDSPLEIIIGGRRDPKFGITLLFGQGGIFVEEQKDTNFALLPLTSRDLDEMIETTRIWQTLKSFQVKPAIKEVILKIAKLMLENDDIQTIELNPLKVLSQKIIAVDINLTRVK